MSTYPFIKVEASDTLNHIERIDFASHEIIPLSIPITTLTFPCLTCGAAHGESCRNGLEICCDFRIGKFQEFYEWWVSMDSDLSYRKYCVSHYEVNEQLKKMCDCKVFMNDNREI